jgi:hypothetical protein
MKWRGSALSDTIDTRSTKGKTKLIGLRINSEDISLNTHQAVLIIDRSIADLAMSDDRCLMKIAQSFEQARVIDIWRRKFLVSS